MFLQFNDAARLVLRLAQLEARAFHHEFVDTEHVLLALVQLHGCVASRVLAKGGIVLPRVRNVVRAVVSPGCGSLTDAHRTLTPGSQKAIELAIAAAVRLGHTEVGTGHILLGVLEEAEGAAFQVLCKMQIVRLGENLSRIAEHVITEMNRDFPSGDR